jgi:hypothetical protein
MGEHSQDYHSPLPENKQEQAEISKSRVEHSRILEMEQQHKPGYKLADSNIERVGNIAELLK